MAKKQKSTNISTSKELRALAVERLEQKHLSTGVPTLSNLSSPEKMLRLVHELEVHQIELEMEQEELTRTRAEAEDSLAKYTELYDFAPVGYLTLSHDSTIRQANLTSAKLLGVDRSHLLGLSLKHFVLPEDYRVIDHLIETVFTRRVSDNCEVKLLANAFQPPKVNPLLSGCTVRIEAGIKDSENACRVILFDITEQKRIETDIIESKTRLSHALKAAYAGVWEWNLETDENIWSDEVWSLYGLRRGGEKPSFRLWADSVHPDDREKTIQAVTVAADKAQELDVEYRVCFPDGSIHWIMARGQPLFNENGQASRYIGTVIDITERKLAEIALKKMSVAVEQSPTIVVMTDVQGNIEYVNPMFPVQTGYTFEEVSGKNPSILKSGLTPKSVYEDLWNTILAGNIWRGELQNKKKNGELYWERVLISAILDVEGTITNFVGIKEDITEHKKAEQLVADGRLKLEAALASMSDAVFISDTNGDFINYNEAFATFHKFTNKKGCPLTLDEYPKILEVYLLTGELVPLENWVVPRALRGETGTGVEFRLLRKDSGETWIGSYNYAPIRDKEGLSIGSVVTARDVSESKAAEQKIRDYVKQLEGAMKSTLQAVAKVVEAHDPYTAGHERRVGQIAADIAQEMGWSEEKCQTMLLVGLVHDIGKMSIPGEILTKPGKLSAIEFELVKTHAENGYEILHDVEFPLPIARIIREHHERMDGSGYPHGLKGENILPESRILAVADVLEAMASNRPYRASLGIDAAISEIETHCDSLFDPVMVNATLRLFREKGYNLPD
jgi:PAS domain S-box-containing protein/putative nucleotidyltransferase with HDIG domain